MGMTQPNGNSGTYRVPANRVGVLGMVDCAVFGDVVDRLGSFESLSMEPEELKKIVERYQTYGHLFKK